jgi:hypothetical protein
MATHPEFAGYGGRIGARNSAATESMHPYVSRRPNSITGGQQSGQQHDDGPSVTEQLQSMGEDVRQKFYSLASKWTAKANEVVAGNSSTTSANSGNSSSSARSHANANVPLMSRDGNDGSDDDDKAEVVSFDTDTATTRRATGRSTSANASSIPNSSSSGSVSSSSSAFRPVAKKDK